MYTTRVPKAHLTLPYLRYLTLLLLPYLTYRNKKHPQKTAVPKQQLDAVAVVGGADKPSPKGSSQVPGLG